MTHKVMITASVFWISQAAALSTFNDYLMSLGEEQVNINKTHFFYMTHTY
jgi:hypothetical protein